MLNLRRTGPVDTALDATERRLRRAGLLLSPLRRVLIRGAGASPLPVAAVGFARAVDGHANGRPTGGVVALSIVVLVFGLIQFVLPPGHRSTEGSAAVRSLRDELDRYADLTNLKSS